MPARIFIGATAAVFLLFGLWGLATPAEMLSRFGVAVGSGDGKTAVRAMYGGFLIGAGALFLFCGIGPSRVTFGLQSILIITTAIFASRVVGMVLDHAATPYHLSYGALEVVGIAASAGFLWLGARAGAS